MKKIKPLALAVALGVSGASNAAVLFDPTGSGGGSLIDVFDWAPSSGVAIGGDHSGEPAGSTFLDTTLAHARLTETTLDGSQVHNGSAIPEITFRTGFNELTLVNSPTSVSFTTGGGDPNFFEIYADTGAIGGTGSDNLTGLGFGDDATDVLILSGTITSVVGGFTSFGTVDLFDQFGTDNYGGQQTIVGAGGTNLEISVAITNFDPLYFPGGVTSLNLAFNTSVVNPFNQANPSQLHNLAANGVLGTSGALAAYDPNLAFINGGFAFSGCGPNTNNCVPGTLDFQFQQDGNAAVSGTRDIPEPGTLTLLGFGLAGLGAVLRRKKAVARKV